MIPHAEVGRPRCFLPQDVIVAIVAFERTRKSCVESGFSILHRLHRDTGGYGIDRAFTTYPVLRLMGLCPTGGLEGFRGGEKEN